MMERIIHQIWVGPYPMPERERSYVERIKLAHPRFTHMMWTDANLPALPPNIRWQFDQRATTQDYAFQADVLRPLIVCLFGGVYLDVDYAVDQGFANVDFDAIHGLFYHHNIKDVSIPNATIGLNKGHPLAFQLVNSIRNDKCDYGPHWLGAEVRKYLGLDINDDHRKVAPALHDHGIAYFPEGKGDDIGSPASQGKIYYDMFRHDALYSWSKENKERFAKGEMK